MIKCIAPSDLTGSLDLTVTFNGKTQTESGFTVSTVSESVVGVDKTSVSAVQKQNLVITADSAPSSNIDDYYGLLVSPTKELRMKVNSIAANGGNHDFTVRFPGAPGGDDFTVYLVYNGQRFASTHTLSTQTSMTDISVTGSSGTDVSKHGGNVITITGTAFSTDIDDLIVLVGASKATIVTSTGTEITARVPLSETEEEAEVSVFQKPNVPVV